MSIYSVKHYNLGVLQRAKSVALEIYHLTNSFPKHELYGLTSQMRKAGTSIGANIFEGEAFATTFPSRRRNHLFNAVGSVNETRFDLEFSHELGYVDTEMFERLDSELVEVSKMLYGLIRKVEGDIRKHSA